MKGIRIELDDRDDLEGLSLLLEARGYRADTVDALVGSPSLIVHKPWRVRSSTFVPGVLDALRGWSLDRDGTGAIVVDTGEGPVEFAGTRELDAALIATARGR